MMTAQANENAKLEASERGISNKQDLPGHTLIFLKVTSAVFTTQILLFKSDPKCSSVNNEVIVSMLYINIRILHKNAQLRTFHSQHATKQHVFTTVDYYNTYTRLLLNWHASMVSMLHHEY